MNSAAAEGLVDVIWLDDIDEWRWLDDDRDDADCSWLDELDDCRWLAGEDCLIWMDDEDEWRWLERGEDGWMLDAEADGWILCGWKVDEAEGWRLDEWFEGTGSDLVDSGEEDTEPKD